MQSFVGAAVETARQLIDQRKHRFDGCRRLSRFDSMAMLRDSNLIASRFMR